MKNSSRKFPGVLPRRLARLPWNAARRKLVNGFWVTINQIAGVLLLGTDLLIIGKFLGPAAVVPYACTAKLIMVLANQPQMLGQLAVPALSQLRAQPNRDHLSGVCIALSQAILLVSGAVACVVLATNHGFVSWWVGAPQFAGLGLTVCVLLNMLLRHLNLSVGYTLFAFGYERRLAITALIDGSVTVCSTIVLTRQLGLIGAPIGMLFGVCLISLPGNISALASADAVPVSRFLKSLAPWTWRFALIALAAGGFAKRVLPNNSLKLAATALVVAGVYALVMMPIAWRDPLGEYLRPRLAPLTVRLFGVLPGGANIVARLQRAGVTNE